VEFICSVGHAFSLTEVYTAEEEQVEYAQWSLIVLLKHLQLVLQLESEPDTQQTPAISPHDLQQRLEPISRHITLVERMIEETKLPTLKDGSGGGCSCALREPMKEPVIKRDVIVIGASAGGVAVLRTLCAALPRDLPAVVGVVLHRGPYYGGDVSSIYGRSGRIRVQEAIPGNRLEQGSLYFAPADHHMEFQDTFIHLSRGPKMHFTRPAIDPLFISPPRPFRSGWRASS
jgi:chemotaxis response regulator CheB